MLVSIVAICSLTSCSGKPEQDPSSLVWAIEPAFQHAYQFTCHAAYVIDRENVPHFIDSNGNILFDSLQIIPGENLEFSGGVIQKVNTMEGEKKYPEAA